MSRRHFLRGLFAAPAIVAAASLMPVRGIVMKVRPPLLLEGAGPWTWHLTGEPWAMTLLNRNEAQDYLEHTCDFLDSISDNRDVSARALIIRESMKQYAQAHGRLVEYS